MNRDTIASKVGRPPKFKTPEELQEKAEGYFQYCEDPKNWVQAYQKKATGAKQGGKGNEAKADEGILFIPKPYTLDGLALWIGVADWAALKQSDCYQTPEFLGVIRTLETRVREKQVVGAMCGVYAPNLVARLNGIADKTDLNLNTEQQQSAEDALKALKGQK